MQIRVHSFFYFRSARNGKMLSHLTDFVRIWSLLVGLTKCAAPLAILGSAIGQMRCAFGQMRRLVKCALQAYSVSVTIAIAGVLLVAFSERKQCCKWSKHNFILFVGYPHLRHSIVWGTLAAQCHEVNKNLSNKFVGTRRWYMGTALLVILSYVPVWAQNHFYLGWNTLNMLSIKYIIMLARLICPVNIWHNTWEKISYISDEEIRWLGLHAGVYSYSGCCFSREKNHIFTRIKLFIGTK